MISITKMAASAFFVGLLASTPGGASLFGSRCPSWACGAGGNHNETLRFAGGCPSWMCGAGGNHNETLGFAGKCPSWLCGAGSNHSDTVLRATAEAE